VSIEKIGYALHVSPFPRELTALLTAMLRLNMERDGDVSLKIYRPNSLEV
jgi:hypothetical protein